MKYSLFLFREAISQWRDSYIDYEYLKHFIMLLKVIVEQIEQLKEMIKDSQETSCNASNAGKSQNKSSFSNVQEKLKDIENLQKIGENLNVLFLQRFQSEVVICTIFCQIKFREVSLRYQKCKQFEIIIDKSMKKSMLIPFIECTYTETIYLSKMIESNLQAERKIIKKHKKYNQKIFVNASFYFKQNVNKKASQNLSDQIEDYYVNLDHRLLNKTQKKKKIRSNLRSLAAKPPVTNTQSLSLGFLIGIVLAVIVFMSFLLAYSGRSVETDPIFNRDFPIWRGSAFVILYVWIIGLNVYFFEKYMISHRIIFDLNQKGKTNSNRIFNIAGLFSTIFVIIFSAYALKLSDHVHYESIPHRFLGLINWVVILIILLNPLPILYRKSRLFLAKLFLKVLLSPFIGVPFLISWTTDQFVSLVTPFEDLAYTICYYTKIDFSNPDFIGETNPCRSSTRIAVFIFACITFGYRISQCLRQGYDKGKFFGEHQFYNSIKYGFSLLTLITSYQWRGGISNYFPAWLTFAIISTIYSYLWDLKIDWDLLKLKSSNCLLRDKVTYKPRNYYIIMVSNLLLRVAWVSTISSNITDRAFGSPELFRLITGSLQIIRRGIWNLLRVEKEHIKNCDQFKAVYPRQRRLQNSIDIYFENNKNKANMMSRQNLESPQQLHIDDLLKTQIKNEIPPVSAEFQTLKDVRFKIDENQVLKVQCFEKYKQLKKQAEQILKRNKFESVEQKQS